MALPLPGLPEDEKGDFLCHQCTLLDGELVKDTWPDGSTRVSFLIYDAVCINRDITVSRRNLLERLKLALLNVVRPRVSLENERFDILEGEKKSNNYLPIYLKDFFEIWDVIAIKNFSKRLPHLSDGIIFTPVTFPYVPGTCRQLMKWKPPELNTLDFASEMLYAMCGPDGKLVPVGSRLLIGSRGFRVDSGCWIVPGKGGWNMMAERQVQFEDCDGAIWECYFDPKVVSVVPALCTDISQVINKLEKWKAIIQKAAAKTADLGGVDGMKRLRRTLNEVDDVDDVIADEELCKKFGYPDMTCPLARVGTGNSTTAWYDYNQRVEVEGGWVLERIRTDKTTPNDERVMVKIKESIDSCISIEALFEHILSVRNTIEPCYKSCALPEYYKQHGTRLQHPSSSSSPVTEHPVVQTAVPESSNQRRLSVESTSSSGMDHSISSDSEENMEEDN